MLLTFAAFMGSLEQGMIYAILALGVFLSFRTLNLPDLTVDGSIVTGAAASAVICSIGGNPLLGLLLAFICGLLAGTVTALLNTKLKIQPLLAGILVMFGLYSINLRIMGSRPNIPLTRSDTLYKWAENSLHIEYPKLIMGVVILAIIIILFFFFLKTRIGFALRATGDNEDMVRAYAINSDGMKVLGLALSNGFVALAGGMLAQYQSFADVTMGTGMVVIGLASVILGEAIFGTKSLLRRLIAVSLGAVVYRLIIAQAFKLGLPTSDLKLVSAAIITIALAVGAFGGNFSLNSLFAKKEAK
ncbi:ABC transporter permease [Anaerovorax odorimutans]|uniref:ABC transporter permease n=1 Tax=Anaerovorax odorimutans TaxID=109327 RepID=UPI0004177DC9|nr:ABC transporter permease [Anaerovorax odorimutans]